VHDGTAEEMRAKRAVTLDGAYAANPARFRHRRPRRRSCCGSAAFIESDAQKKP